MARNPRAGNRGMTQGNGPSSQLTPGAGAEDSRWASVTHGALSVGCRLGPKQSPWAPSQEKSCFGLCGRPACLLGLVMQGVHYSLQYLRFCSSYYRERCLGIMLFSSNFRYF